MKKYLAMLVVLFTLGACSTSNNNVEVNSDWKLLVADKYVYVTGTITKGEGTTVDENLWLNSQATLLRYIVSFMELGSGK